MSYVVSEQITIESKPTTAGAFPVATTTIAWDKERVFQKTDTSAFSLSGATNTNLFPSGMTAIKRLFIRVYGGYVQLKVTSAAGTTQIIPCDEILLLDSQTQPITALTASGTAEIEVFAAGD